MRISSFLAMTNSHLKAKIYMKQLSKIETIIYAIGGLMMALGTGLYVFFIKQDIACIVMLIGSIGFATIQMRQQYLGTNFAIRRLRRIMVIADIGFILAGLFMVGRCIWNYTSVCR